MILVMTAAVLVLVNIRSRNELEESKRGFYSENASYLVNEENDWNAIEDILEKDDWNNGILYKKDLQMAEDIRGVFYKEWRRISEGCFIKGILKNFLLYPADIFPGKRFAATIAKL